MGKGKKPAKGGSRMPKDGEDSDSGSEEDTKRPVERSVGKQRSNVGMMPPSDSESGSDEEEGEPKPAAPKGKAAHGGQPATAGMLPPSDSEGEDEDEEDESDDEDEGATAVREKRAAAPVEKSAKEIAAELAKLELVRKRRADQAAQRIASEGFDRFAPK